MNDKYIISHVIQHLRFPMIFCILYLHVVLGVWSDGAIDKENLPDAYALVRLSVTEGFCRYFVGVFFTISGYLFFRTGTLEYKDRVRSRWKSLIVPYIFWNLAVVAMYWAGELVFPSMMGTSVKPVSEYTFFDWFRCFWDLNEGAPINLPLWYVRDLICLVLLSPIVYAFVRYAKIYGVLGLGVWWMLYGVPGHVAISVFFFTLGAWIAINQVENVRVLIRHRVLLTVLFLATAIVGVALLWNEVAYAPYVLRVAALIKIAAIVGWMAWMVCTDRENTSHGSCRRTVLLCCMPIMPCLLCSLPSYACGCSMSLRHGNCCCCSSLSRLSLLRSVWG